MAVATLPEAKKYLQISTGDDDELITTLLSGVEAIIEKNLYSIITAAEETDYLDGGGNSLLLTNIPVSTEADLTVIDEYTDTTLNEDLYRLTPTTGELWNNGIGVYSLDGSQPSAKWPSGYRRWKITYTGGLSLHSDFAGVTLQLKLAEFLWLSDFYSHRQASTTSEKIDVFVEKYLLTANMPGRVQSALIGLLDIASDI